MSQVKHPAWRLESAPSPESSFHWLMGPLHPLFLSHQQLLVWPSSRQPSRVTSDTNMSTLKGPSVPAFCYGNPDQNRSYATFSLDGGSLQLEVKLLNQYECNKANVFKVQGVDGEIWFTVVNRQVMWTLHWGTLCLTGADTMISNMRGFFFSMSLWNRCSAFNLTAHRGSTSYRITS